MRCSQCGLDNRETARFCDGCGAKLQPQCPSCGALIRVGARFCDACGATLSQSPSHSSSPPAATAVSVRVRPESAAPQAPEGERKTVTALFADIKGSTELMEDLDPEEASVIIDPALKIMVEAVRRYEGYVVQSTGDGIFALFGAPVAHEDHPQRALYAALQIQQELRKQSQLGRPALEARIGVNTGEVVVRTVETGGKVEYTPIGHTANLASRLQTIAPAGSIAVSEQTRKLVEGYFEVRGLGPAEVKGVSEPVNVYEVTGLGPLRSHFQLAARRGLTKFVGRENELVQMKRGLELTRAGHGQIVAVVAEAGTGKSRLFHEFKATLPTECKLLEAYSVSHGKASAWLPVLELLRGYFGIQDADVAMARREKVRTALAALDPALSDALPYVCGLLAIEETPDPLAQMDPQVRRRRTLDALKRIIIRESLNQPTAVIFEDLHWIDGETQALLDLLADSIANSRVLLLVNYRPEYHHGWANKSYYSQFRLGALGRESAAEMLAALLGEGIELLPLKRLVTERTEGNPFFIEEMIQALFDEGALVRNGAIKVTRSMSQLQLPPTVQGILAARIDRLPAEQKELLQTLAVIGRESLLALARQVVSKAGAQLDRMLMDLQAGEFIYEQLAPPDFEYVFKHALTQEVAYNSLLVERRKSLHERTGRALESMFASQMDDHISELARHYSLSDNVEKAVEYLGRSGQQAMQRSAYADAISSLNAAINSVSRLPDSTERIQTELSLQLNLGLASIPIKGWVAPEVVGACTRARELCGRLGDPPELYPALFGLCSLHLLRGELRAACALAEQLVRRAQIGHDPMLLVYAHGALGFSLFQLGELPLARKNFEQAWASYDYEQHGPLPLYGVVDGGVSSLSYLGTTLWQLGYPDEGLIRSNEAVALARRLSHPFSIQFAEFFLANFHQCLREPRATQESAERLLTLSEEHGMTTETAYATIQRGWAMGKFGRSEEGIAQIQEGLAALHATGTDLGRPFFLSMLVDLFTDSGRPYDALSALREAFAAAENTDDRNCEAELHRLMGEVVLLLGGSDAAEVQTYFERAIKIAAEQGAKSWELRATTSLARLLATQGKRDEARTMLAEIYNWFTEGFDTADLKDAKVLLDELGN